MPAPSSAGGTSWAFGGTHGKAGASAVYKWDQPCTTFWGNEADEAHPTAGIALAIKPAFLSNFTGGDWRVLVEGRLARAQFWGDQGKLTFFVGYLPTGNSGNSRERKEIRRTNDCHMCSRNSSLS